jgi:hypothetical protein
MPSSSIPFFGDTFLSLGSKFSMTIYYNSVLIILDGLAERSCSALRFVLTLRICLSTCLSSGCKKKFHLKPIVCMHASVLKRGTSWS